MFTQHLIHVKPWRAEDIEKEPPASALLCPNHPAVWQHVLNYTAAAAWQNKLYLKKYSLKKGALLHRSLHLFLVFLRKPHSPVEIVAPQPSSLFRVQRRKSFVHPQHVNHLNQGMAAPGGAHRRAGAAGSQVRAGLCPGHSPASAALLPCCSGTILLQALGQVDFALEAAPELLLELLLAMEESREFVIVDLQYINSLNQVRLIPPPTTRSRV